RHLARDGGRGATPAGNRHFRFGGFPEESYTDNPQARRNRLANFQRRTILPAPALIELDANGVFGIDWEVIAEGKTTARIEGQIVGDPLVPLTPAAPRRIFPGGELFHSGFDGCVPHGEATNQPRRRHVLYEQRRRDREHVAYVVEAI